MASLSNRVKLLKGLLTRDTAYTGPFYICVDVTSRCNLQCLCCPYHSPLSDNPVSGKNDISFDIFAKLCQEIKIMGTKTIVLQGEGEPLLHPRVFDLISATTSPEFDIKKSALVL